MLEQQATRSLSLQRREQGTLSVRRIVDHRAFVVKEHRRTRGRVVRGPGRQALVVWVPGARERRPRAAHSLRQLVLPRADAVEALSALDIVEHKAVSKVCVVRNLPPATSGGDLHVK